MKGEEGEPPVDAMAEEEGARGGGEGPEQNKEAK